MREMAEAAKRLQKLESRISAGGGSFEFVLAFSRGAVDDHRKLYHTASINMQVCPQLFSGRSNTVWHCSDIELVGHVNSYHT